MKIHVKFASLIALFTLAVGLYLGWRLQEPSPQSHHPELKIVERTIFGGGPVVGANTVGMQGGAMVWF